MDARRVGVSERAHVCAKKRTRVSRTLPGNVQPMALTEPSSAAAASTAAAASHLQPFVSRQDVDFFLHLEVKKLLLNPKLLPT